MRGETFAGLSPWAGRWDVFTQLTPQCNQPQPSLHGKLITALPNFPLFSLPHISNMGAVFSYRNTIDFLIPPPVLNLNIVSCNTFRLACTDYGFVNVSVNITSYNFAPLLHRHTPTVTMCALSLLLLAQSPESRQHSQEMPWGHPASLWSHQMSSPKSLGFFISNTPKQKL